MSPTALLLATLLPAVALAERPGAAEGPTVVSVALWVVDLERIDSVEQTYTASVVVGLRWRDPRLADPAAGRRTVDLSEVWSPSVVIRNQTGALREVFPRVAQVEPDGQVLLRQLYVGKLAQPLDLRDFPFDAQRLGLHLVAMGHPPEEVQLSPDPQWVTRGLPDAAGVAPGPSIPDWTVVSTSAGPAPYEVVPGARLAGYALQVTVRRAAAYYVAKVIVPLLLIVLMSWSVFFVDPKSSGTRMGIATTSMLTLIAYRFAIDAQVPRVPYMTRLDLFVITSTGLVFLALAQAVLLDNLFRAGRDALALGLNRVSARALPAAFLVTVVWSLVL